jgi:hypothetical protein
LHDFNNKKLRFDVPFDKLEIKHIAEGWKFFKVYHIGWKRPSPYCSPFLLYILIPIKNNESKFVKMIIF